MAEKFAMALGYGVAICCCALMMNGQTADQEPMSVAPAPSARFPAEWYPADDMQEFSMFHDTDAPYTAVMVTTVSFPAVAGSGQLASRSDSEFQARDSAGRTRTETSRLRSGADGRPVEAHEVSVNDPVSHCSFQWEEPWTVAGEPTATVRCMPRRVRFSTPTVWIDSIRPKDVVQHVGNQVEEYRTEVIGSRTFDGVEASGVRNTKTVTDTETGKVETLVTELWYSEGLKELIELKAVPVQAGFPDFELTKIRRGEPDAKLFYPPAGYKIVP